MNACGFWPRPQSLRGRFLDVLVTNELTALRLLELERERPQGDGREGDAPQLKLGGERPAG